MSRKKVRSRGVPVTDPELHTYVANLALRLDPEDNVDKYSFPEDDLRICDEHYPFYFEDPDDDNEEFAYYHGTDSEWPPELDEDDDDDEEDLSRLLSANVEGPESNRTVIPDASDQTDEYVSTCNKSVIEMPGGNKELTCEMERCGQAKSE